MLDLHYAPDWRRLQAAVFAELKQAVAAELPGQLLLVPEQFSFEAEWGLCEAAGVTASRYAEVLSFSRLAHRAMATHGGIAKPMLDQGGRLMALSAAVELVSGKLKFYAGAAGRGEFLTGLLSMVDELKSYGVDSAALSRGAEQLEGALAEKTGELALLLEAYEAVCAQGAADPKDALHILKQHIERLGFGGKNTFYVDGFFGFTATELEVLGALLRAGANIHVYLCCDGLFEGAQVFSAVRATAAGLMTLAAQCGAEVHERPCEGEARPAQLVALSAFTRVPAPWQGLHLHTFPSDSAQVEALCCALSDYARQGGRWRDAMVACPPALRPRLEAELTRYGIPAFFAGKQSALTTPLLGAVCAALEACAYGMETASVLAYLKSDCAPLTQEESDALEHYIYIWRFHGKQWETPWHHHPAGLCRKWEQEDTQRLEEYNHLRERAVMPLVRLHHAMQEAQTVGGCVLAVYAFLQEVEFSQSVSRRLAALEAEGAQTELNVTRQLYELLLHALEQLYSVQANARRSPEEFVRLFEILLSQYEVGAIPAMLDAVTVGEPAQLQHRAAKRLFICGCGDGCLPQTVTGGSLLTEQDRQSLRELGITLAPQASEQMDRAMVGAYALLCAPEEALWMSAAGEQSAYLFETLCRLYSVSDPILPPEAPIEQSDYLRQPLSAPTVRALYGDPVTLSASKIDLLASCRFSFFLQYGLKAKEWKQADFDAPIFGTFVHSVLEKTLRGDGDLEACMDACFRALDPELLASPRFTYIMNRNFQEIRAVAAVLRKELDHSKFVPHDFELRFGRDGTLPALPIETPLGSARLQGVVDRVDVLDVGDERFFRVVDYKTGKKELDYTDLLEGRGLQMLLYLFALQEHSHMHPAGVLYVPARDAVESYSQKPPEDMDFDQAVLEKHRRSGLLLKDEVLLAAQDADLMPFQKKKDAYAGDLMDHHELSLLRSHVQGKVAEMTGELLSGLVEPNPYVRSAESSCTYCPYAAVCRIGHIRPKSLKRTGAVVFWNILEEKEENHGKLLSDPGAEGRH